MTKNLFALSMVVVVFVAGCTPIVPVLWPRIHINGNEYAPGLGVHVPGIPGSDEYTAPNGSGGWSLWDKVKVFGTIAFVVWLLGISGLTWLWRRSAKAFRQVVYSAEKLKETISDRIEEDVANDILRVNQDEDVKKMVKKVKGKK